MVRNTSYNFLNSVWMKTDTNSVGYCRIRMWNRIEKINENRIWMYSLCYHIRIEIRISILMFKRIRISDNLDICYPFPIFSASGLAALFRSNDAWMAPVRGMCSSSSSKQRQRWQKQWTSLKNNRAGKSQSSWCRPLHAWLHVHVQHRWCITTAAD